jgi:hypothetical protein
MHALAMLLQSRVLDLLVHLTSLGLILLDLIVTWAVWTKLHLWLNHGIIVEPSPSIKRKIRAQQ